MLWTDSVFLTATDLARVDGEVATLIPQAEGITLTGDNGILRVSVEESANEMMKYIVAYGGYLSYGDVSTNHLAAVLNVGIGNSVRSKASLQQICVSGDVPGQWNWVRQWAVFWALRTFYRDAYGRTGGADRYKMKMEFYQKEAEQVQTANLYTLGLPIVTRPLSRPAATFERDSGDWDTDNLSLTSGSGTWTTASICDVAITYCDMSQSNLYVSSTSAGNAESEPSDTVSLTMETGKVLTVDISSLVPPTGAQHPSQISQIVISPLKATHWNVYAGITGGTLYLQNASPIPIATTSYTFSGDPVLSGHKAGIGQYPDRRLSLCRTRQRA